MNDTYRETTLTLAGVATVIRTERTGRMTVAKLENAHYKAVKAAVAVHRASVGKPKAFPNHTRDNIGYVDCRKGDAPIRYTSIDPDALVADWADVDHERISPYAPDTTPAPTVKLPVAGVDFLAGLFEELFAAR